MSNRAELYTLATNEARSLGQNEICPEHFLLALFRQLGTFACQALKSQGVEYNSVLLRIMQDSVGVKSGEEIKHGRLPLSLAARKAIEYAIGEARNLQHNRLDSEHILLGLMRPEIGLAFQVLRGLRVDTDALRFRVIDELRQR